MEPTFSPNGKQIAFVSDQDGQFEIYLMEADGPDRRRLTTEPGLDRDPSWAY